MENIQRFTLGQTGNNVHQDYIGIAPLGDSLSARGTDTSSANNANFARYFLAPGANLGEDLAVFEPTHGSAPKYAGQNKVNPMAIMLSGVMMLRHLGETKTADRLEKAIAEVIAEGKDVTYDMKPNIPNAQVVGTSQVADAVIEKLGKS